MTAAFDLELHWIFFQLVPGETALAFYTATNPTNEPITGISTYNVIPFEAGQYFNKIQVSLILLLKFNRFTPRSH